MDRAPRGAWRAVDADAVADLFTEDVAYRVSPFAEPRVGHETVRAFWLADEGLIFTARAEPVAIERATHDLRETHLYVDARRHVAPRRE